MALAAVTLDDKYSLERGRVYLTGTQALVRLPMMQRQRDAAAGLNTACFISGYRGSPLGGLDQGLWGARRFLERNHIRFQPAINEELGATAVWGSQQIGLFPGAKYDGVFAMWYGKGPGVDRSGDALKHGNAAGSAPHGGVLLLAGDDHTCKSSTLPHQSEYAFMDACIPVLNPSGVQEILDLGLYGWAMSRYSGCWVAFKTIAETVDSSASVEIGPERIEIVLPDDFEMPPGGLNIRWPDQPLDQEFRLHKYKLYAALAFARANRLDRIVIDSPRPRFGIVTTGKSYLDVRQALDDLGIDDAHAAEIGFRLYKVAMAWPLEREGIRHFAEGLEEILVVEEKRAVIENQFKEQLYNWREDVRPRVIGKFDENRNWILPSNGELTPAQIARVIAQRIARFHTSPRIAERLAFLEAKERQLGGNVVPFSRTPYFCSGCPHNTSTKVPEGSRALAGIGCHYLSSVHGPVDCDLYPDGRRRRALDRPGAVHGDAAYIRQSRRRHLHPFGCAGDTRGRRRQRQHHLQTAVQRRRRDDRRAADRRRFDRAGADPPACRRRRAPDRRRDRRARQICAGRRFRRRARPCAIATISTRFSASCARSRA